MIDTIHREDYELLRLILSVSNTPSNVLGILYKYSYGQGAEKESVLSYACRNYLDGRTQVLNRLLTLDCDPKFLTRITLSGVNMRRFPFSILHENLVVLDVRDNTLDQLPTDGADPYRLGWRCPKLEKLNFANNLLTCVPPDIFRLPSLAMLILSGNELRDVPIEMWTAPVLTHLELDNNNIYQLPCPQMVPRTDNFLLYSSITSQQQPKLDSYMYLPSWKRSYVSYNAGSTHDLLKTQSGFALEFLDLKENRLADVPKGLPCLAPQLQTLKLAKNSITNLGTFADYPGGLQSLDVSHNGVTRGIQQAMGAEDFNCLQCQLAHDNMYSHCSHYQHTSLNSLRFLYLCNNRIEDLKIEVERPDLEHSQTPSVEDDGVPPEEADPPGLLYPKLQALKISNNSLVNFPHNIHRLAKLQELVMSGNARITEIPPGLYKLNNLFTFRYEGIQAAVVEELSKLKTTAEVLYHLKARELR